VVFIDEFEVDKNEMPYRYWAKGPIHQKIKNSVKDDKRWFLVCAIDMAGLVAFWVFDHMISTAEKAAFINELTKEFNKLDQGRYNKTNSRRQAMKGSSPLVFY
jgi:hypothetical protein